MKFRKKMGTLILSINFALRFDLPLAKVYEPHNRILLNIEN
jgi:hypothetical protein